MRVQLVDPSAFTPPYDRSLAAALAAAGAEVELITSPFGYGPVPRPEGYEVADLFYRRSARLPVQGRARLAVKALEHPLGMARLARRIRAFGPAVVHYQWLTLPALDRHLIGSRRPAPFRAYTVHYPLPDSARAIARERRVLRGFDLVVAHTERGAEKLRSRLGLDPERVRVIPHGAFEYLTRIENPAPLPAALEAAEGPVVLFFGLLRPYKGIDVLIDAFSRLGPGAELWIAGLPRMPLEPLERAAAAAPGRVRFIPRFISDPEIPALMRRADLLVLPYREIEQSGVLYTGLAFGKPMILSDVGGFGEVAREHNAARLVPPGDPEALALALEALIGDPGERRRLGDAAGAAAAGPFSWAQIARKTLDAYAELSR